MVSEPTGAVEHGRDGTHDPAAGELAQLLSGRRIAILTGAGVSTASGIPDYRSPGRPQRTPIQHREFVTSEAARRRYWARSMVGYSLLSAAQPNAVHVALAHLERARHTTGLVTQNVDQLHQRAGSGRVVELHGALARVVCLGCGTLERRDELEVRLRALNPGVGLGAARLAPGDAESRPDGDAEILGDAERTLVVASCRSCGGVLMPDVVFFGGTVPRARVEEAMAIVEAADALLVLGTSLAVFSGWRFVRRAAERAMPIAIVNRGPTRGDPQATLKVDGDLVEIVPALVAALTASR